MDKLMFTPISLTLYDEDDEPIVTHSKSVIRWGMMKQAMKLGKMIEAEDNELSETTLDALASFVCRLFDDKVTVDDLDKGADISEIMSTFRAVVNRAHSLGNA